MMQLPQYVGWFDAPDQTAPAHMPDDTVKCPVCGDPRGAKGRYRSDGKSMLVSIDVLSRRDPRSLFFLVHRDCLESAPDRVADIESLLVDGVQ